MVLDRGISVGLGHIKPHAVRREGLKQRYCVWEFGGVGVGVAILAWF